MTCVGAAFAASLTVNPGGTIPETDPGAETLKGPNELNAMPCNISDKPILNTSRRHWLAGNRLAGITSRLPRANAYCTISRQLTRLPVGGATLNGASIVSCWAPEVVAITTVLPLGKRTMLRPTASDS